MSTLGFDNYVEPLKLYLQKYREGMKGDKGAGGDEFEGIASAEELMGELGLRMRLRRYCRGGV
jgi:nuclear transcription Y subunit beta